MHNIITFYDIPSTLPDKAWSPKTWRGRYALTYKGLPHKTIWVEYPDIEAVCKKIGAAPTSTRKDGRPLYTLPVIHDPSTGAVISDGAAIAEYLDVTYPSTPRLFPAGTHALQYAFLDAHGTAVDTIWAFIVPASNLILNPPSEKYFRASKEASFGKKMEDITPTGQERVEKWGKLKDGFGVIDGWLTKSGKTYFMGDTVSFADITVVSFVLWLKRVWGEESAEWQDIKGWHGGRWDQLVKAFEKYETVS